MQLAAITDKFQIATSAAAATDVHVSFIEAVIATGAMAGIGKQNTALSSAGTTDILSAPAASNARSVKKMFIRNKDASLSNDITVIFNQSGTSFEIIKQTLQPGETLSFVEGLGFVVNKVATARSGMKNVSTADQAIGASVTAYITGSAILLPNPVVAGMVLRWKIQLGKTAASVAQEVVAVRFGTGGSTSDTARNSFTLDVETAVADEAMDEIEVVIRGPIGASCIAQASLQRDNNLSTTGFSSTARKAQLQAVQSAAFDITPAGTIAGLSYTTGTAHALTVRKVQAYLDYTGG
jgi:hypothetical protein